MAMAEGDWGARGVGCARRYGDAGANRAMLRWVLAVAVCVWVTAPTALGRAHVARTYRPHRQVYVTKTNQSSPSSSEEEVEVGVEKSGSASRVSNVREMGRAERLRALFSLEDLQEDDDVEITDLEERTGALPAVFVSPTSGFFPTYGGVYLEAVASDRFAQEDQKILYQQNGIVTPFSPAFDDGSGFVTLAGSGNVSLQVVSVAEDSEVELGFVRSIIQTFYFVVESENRPLSVAYLTPYWNSYFLKYSIEVQGANRAQLSEIQEFADFFSEQGIGPYSNQLEVLDFNRILQGMRGFDGGIITEHGYVNGTKQFFAVLAPHHNNTKYHGRTPIVHLNQFNASFHNYDNFFNNCSSSYRVERWNNATGTVEVDESGHDPRFGGIPCVTVLDLETLDPELVGFRKAFNSTLQNVTTRDARQTMTSYAYLVPARFSKVVRIDMTNITLASVDVLDLAEVDRSLHGFSSGFADGPYGFLVPFRTVTGPVGGVNSDLSVDANRLEPWYHGTIVRFDLESFTADTVDTLDLTEADLDLRGFSHGIRYAKFGFLVPMQNTVTNPFGKLVRFELEDFSLETLKILDLSRRDPGLKGFSSAFAAGQYLFLSPWRNAYEPTNGMRGFGLVVRVDLNDYSPSGVEFFDMVTTIRQQTPSYPDVQLRGFSFGFASGKYGFFVPFYNGASSGKIARFNLVSMDDLQELNLAQSRNLTDQLTGFTGGLASVWAGRD